MIRVDKLSGGKRVKRKRRGRQKVIKWGGAPANVVRIVWFGGGEESLPLVSYISGMVLARGGGVEAGLPRVAGREGNGS